MEKAESRLRPKEGKIIGLFKNSEFKGQDQSNVID